MYYLIDTNIISERARKYPNSGVIRWLDAIPQDNIYLSVMTIGELRHGAEKCKDIDKRTAIYNWIDRIMLPWFGRRILPVDYEVACKWGKLTGGSKQTLPIVDSLIAATALVHNMNLVTRNTKDFVQIAGLELFNPWNQE